jgi:uncharacterized coiled-coil DUF342 family protein
MSLDDDVKNMLDRLGQADKRLDEIILRGLTEVREGRTELEESLSDLNETLDELKRLIVEQGEQIRALRDRLNR